MNNDLSIVFPSVKDALIKPSDALISTSNAVPKVTSALVHIPYNFRKNKVTIQKRYVKDLGDVFLGGLDGTLQLQNTLDEHDSIFKDVPVLNKLAGLGYLITDRFIDPLLAGRPGEALINTLETAGSSLDIVANPIKSLIPAAGGGTWDDFLKSMGWLEGEYRETYQWNTGNFVVDFLGEMVSDPLNWATFGSNHFVKQGVEIVTPDTSKLLGQVNVAIKSGKKIISKPLSRVLDSAPKEVRDRAIEGVSRALISEDKDAIIKQLRQTFVDQVSELSKDTGRLYFNSLGKRLYLDEISFKQLTNKIIKANASGLYDAYKTASKTFRIVHNFDTNLVKASWGITPVGWGIWSVNHVVKPYFAYVHNNIMKKLANIVVTDPTQIPPQFKRLQKEALLRGKQLSNYVKNGMKTILDNNSITYEDAVNLYIDTISASVSKRGNPRDIAALKELFRKSLMSRLDGVYITKPNDKIWSKLGIADGGFIKTIDKAKVSNTSNYYENIKVIVPDAIYNDFFEEIWSNSQTLIAMESKLLDEHMRIFNEELKAAYTAVTEADTKRVQLRPTINLEQLMDLNADFANFKDFDSLIKYEVHRIEGYIGTLKKLAYDITNASSGWMGSYWDRHQILDMLKEKNPATTYTALKRILDFGIRKKGKRSARSYVKSKELYDRYKKIFERLDKFIEQMPKQREHISDKSLIDFLNDYYKPFQIDERNAKDFASFFGDYNYLRSNLLNTHDRNSKQLVLETLYTIYNDLPGAEPKQFPLRNILSYINGGFMRIGLKVYRIDELPEYLAQATKLGLDITHQKYILEYFGINLDNYTLIGNLFNRRDALAMTKLNALLEQAKVGNRLTATGSELYKNIDMRTSIKRTTIKDILNSVEDFMSKADRSGIGFNAPRFSKVVEESLKKTQELNDYIHNLKFTDVVADEMDYLIQGLNSANIRLDEFDELLNEIIKTDMLSLDTISYLTLDKKAARLIEVIDKAQRYIDKYFSATDTRTARSFLSEVRNTLDLMTVKFQSTLVDQLDFTDNLYMAQLSREARTHILLDAEFSRINTKYGRMFKQLLRRSTSSKARKHVEQMANALDAKHLPIEADRLRELLLHLDNHATLERLLKMNVVPKYVAYDTQTQNFIDSLLYNMFASDRYKDKTVTQMLGELDSFIDDAMRKVEKVINYNFDNIVASTYYNLKDPYKYAENIMARYPNIRLHIISKNSPFRGILSNAFAATQVQKRIRFRNIKTPQIYHIYIRDLDWFGSVDNFFKSRTIDIFNKFNNDFDIEKIKSIIKTDEEAWLTSLFHELAHCTNRDFKKIGAETSLPILDNILGEIEARRSQLKFISDNASRESIRQAELLHIKNNYIAEAKTYLKLIKANEEALGLSDSKVYDVLDGRMLDTVKSLGDSFDAVEALAKDTKDETTLQLVSDYEEFVNFLYGKGELNTRNAMLFSVRNNLLNKLNSDDPATARVVDNLSKHLSNNSFVKDMYAYFDYIASVNRRLAGATGSTRTLGELDKLFTTQQLQKLLGEDLKNYNMYEWSIANKDLSFKKVFDVVTATKDVILPNSDLAIRSNEDYLNFYSLYQKYKSRVQHVSEFYTDERLVKVQNALIKTYKHAGLAIAPKDALTYFTRLDFHNPIDRLRLITWDGLSQDTTLFPNTASSYLKNLGFKVGGVGEKTTYNSIDMFRDPWRWYKLIDTEVIQPDVINIDAINDIINLEPPAYVLEELYPQFDYKLSTLYKSKDKLLKNSIPYTKLIQDDLDVRHFIVDNINKVKTNFVKGPNKNAINFRYLDEPLVDFLKYVGVNDGNRLDSNAMMRAYKGVVQMDEVNTILDSTAEQLRKQVDMRGGFMVYVGDYSKDITFPFKNIKPEDLEKVGLKIQGYGKRMGFDSTLGANKQLITNDYIWFIRRTDKEMTDAKINWKRTPIKHWAFKDMFNLKERIMRKSSSHIDLTDMDIPYYYLTGDTMDVEFYDYLRNMPEFVDFFGDLELQKTYLDLTDAGISKTFTRSYSRPQVVVTGYDGYNKLIDFITNDIGSEINWSHKSTNYLTSLEAGMVDWLTRYNNKTKYMSIFLNDEFDASDELFHQLLDNADDKFLQKFFSKGNYSAVLLKENRKGQPIIYKYFIRNQKQLAEARALGAFIVPEAVYRNMVFSINENNITSKLLMLYRRTIVGMFKSIWLTSPGFLMRNFFDSEVYKNMNETAGAVSLTEMMNYEWKAARLLDQANQIQAEVFARTNNKTFNKSVLTDVLMALPKEDRVLYYLTDTFINSSASGSLTESMQEFLLQFNKAGVDGAEYAWERILNKAVFEGSLSPTRMIMDVNGKIEQSARYGLFLALIDKGGLSVDEALTRVIRTHFDYTTKSSLEDSLEQLFWFVTFPINNILYFVNEGLERNPALLRAYMDINELSWNNGEYTYDEIKEKPYLQYHLLAGNIRIRNRAQNKDYIIKLGPSLFDFFNFMVNPIGEALNRLNPFISVPLGLDEPSELIPFRAQLSRLKTIKDTGNPVPSILSVLPLYNYPNYRRRYYSNYSGSSWNFKRRPRKVYPKPTYYSGTYNFVRRNYPSRGYWKRNKYSTNWFASIDKRPYRQPTVPLDPRFYRQLKRLSNSK